MLIGTTTTIVIAYILSVILINNSKYNTRRGKISYQESLIMHNYLLLALTFPTLN